MPLAHVHGAESPRGALALLRAARGTDTVLCQSNVSFGASVRKYTYVVYHSCLCNESCIDVEFRMFLREEQGLFSNKPAVN